MKKKPKITCKIFDTGGSIEVLDHRHRPLVEVRFLLDYRREPGMGERLHVLHHVMDKLVELEEALTAHYYIDHIAEYRKTMSEVNWTEGCPPRSPSQTNGILRKYCVQTDSFEHDIIWYSSHEGGVWRSEVYPDVQYYHDSFIKRYIEVTTQLQEGRKP